MKLEWDADKAICNLKKHGVSFEDAELVFYDSGRVEAYDGRETTGKIAGPRLALLIPLSFMWSIPFETRTPSVLYPRGKQMPTKESNIVQRTLDLKKPPPLSAEQKARLDAVASMPDEQIDDSDAPYLPDAA